MAESNFKQWMMTDVDLQYSFNQEIRKQFMSRMASDEIKYLLLYPDGDEEEWTAIMSDYKYWGQPEIKARLDEWCKEHNSRVEGMTITFPDEETAMMFKLSWS